MTPSRLRTLLVYVHYPERLSYFDDWRDAFRSAPEFEIIAANIAMPWGRVRLRRNIAEVDLVVLLHSVVGDSLKEVRRLEAEFGRRRGPLLAFVGNEVNLPTQPITAKLEILQELGAEYIGTQLLREAGEFLYAGIPSARIVALPHALNPAVFRSQLPTSDRQIDVGFRGARYGPEVGDDDRNRVIDFFTELGRTGRLRTDIETGLTLGRGRWSAFLNQCRGTIGVEAGSDYLTTATGAHGEGGRGEAQASGVPSDQVRAIGRYLPRAVKYPLRRAFMRQPAQPPAGVCSPNPRPSVYGKCISSRHFDAIGTETCQIMFPGRYNDLLEPDVHYLRLEPDFSNIDSVLARLADETYLRRVVEETRSWAMEAHTYRHRVRHALSVITDGH